MDFDRIKRQMSHDLDEQILSGIQTSPASCPWDAPDHDPLFDLENANRLLQGKGVMIDARKPVEGVHQITSL